MEINEQKEGFSYQKAMLVRAYVLMAFLVLTSVMGWYVIDKINKKNQANLWLSMITQQIEIIHTQSAGQKDYQELKLALLPQKLTKTPDNLPVSLTALKQPDSEDFSTFEIKLPNVPTLVCDYLLADYLGYWIKSIEISSNSRKQVYEANANLKSKQCNEQTSIKITSY